MLANESRYHKRWTREEVVTLREAWGHGRDWQGWEHVLPGREWCAIERKAKALGLEGGIMESRDGTSIEEIVGEWLRANHYDGLCNPDAECGCSLDDLMPFGEPNPSGCLCGYKVPAPDGTNDQWFSVSSDEQNEPSDTLENATRDLYAFADEAINTGHHTKPKAALEGFRIRLAALGVNVDE